MNFLYYLLFHRPSKYLYSHKLKPFIYYEKMPIINF